MLYRSRVSSAAQCCRFIQSFWHHIHFKLNNLNIYLFLEISFLYLYICLTLSIFEKKNHSTVYLNKCYEKNGNIFPVRINLDV